MEETRYDADKRPTINTKTSDSIRYPLTSHLSPKLTLVENPIPSLTAKVSPSNRRNVVEVIVRVSPRKARTEWKPLLLRFLAAKPRGPINLSLGPLSPTGRSRQLSPQSAHHAS